jgi:hypothetical protein
MSAWSLFIFFSSADSFLLFQKFPDTVEFCETMADKGKTVIVAALDGTFQREVRF